MFKSLWIRFLLLLVLVVIVGLSGTFLLRELMVGDFREYLEGEMEDRVSWLTASLESSYATNLGWRREDLVEAAVWALMMGMDIRLSNIRGTPLVDTGQAVESLSPLVKKRVLAFTQQRRAGGGEEYIPYGLFLRGEQIAELGVRFLPPGREALFVRRSNRFLLFSVFALGGTALLFSVVFSRKLTEPIHSLTDAASRVADGDLKSRVAVSRDDELGRLSHTFNRMAQALMTHETLKRRLTANIAHELRTPLGAVRAELEGMMDGLIPVERKTLESLYAEIGRLKTILEGIEELTQAEASSLSMAKKSLELGPFLENILHRFRKMFTDKGVALELHCPPGLAAHADPDKLSQVVINLLSNALRATDAGGTVRVEASEGGDMTEIAVADTGGGIGEEDLPFVFERFYRGRAQASHGGLGLGLTIVKELVEAHDGEVKAESAPGEGSRFRLTLPR
jgi:two-component system sensor histidine kinase BaeS